MEAMEMGLGGNSTHIGGMADRERSQCFKSGRNQAVFSRGERIAYGVGRALRSKSSRSGRRCRTGTLRGLGEGEYLCHRGAADEIHPTLKVVG